MVKVLVTVIIYGLFMWDSHCQDGLWESLDDWVYYIRLFLASDWSLMIT